MPAVARTGAPVAPAAAERRKIVYCGQPRHAGLILLPDGAGAEGRAPIYNARSALGGAQKARREIEEAGFFYLKLARAEPGPEKGRDAGKKQNGGVGIGGIFTDDAAISGDKKAQ